MSPRARRERGWMGGELTASAAEETARGLRRRLILSLAAAFAVLLALAALARGCVEGDRPAIEARTSLSARANGYRGIFEVLKKLGFRSERHRRSYAMLPPAGESVLVIIDPLPDDVLERFQDTRMDAAQARELRGWISRGGRVVAAPPGRRAASAFGLSIEPGRGETAIERLFGEATIFDQLVEGGAPARDWRPVLGSVQGTGSLSGFSDAWPAPVPPRERLASAFLRRAAAREIFPGVEREGQGPVELEAFTGDLPAGLEPAATLGRETILATAGRGDGRVWLFSSAYPFTNLALAEGGTGPLLCALIAEAAEGGRRAVYFDEYSHGLWGRRGILGWVFGTTLFYPVAGAVLLAAALLWRGAVRPGAAARPRALPRRAKEEFVVSLGDILLRAGRHRAAARSLVEAFRQRNAAFAHRLAALDGEVNGAGPFGAQDLKRVAARIDEEKQRIAAEESQGAMKP